MDDPRVDGARLADMRWAITVWCEATETEDTDPPMKTRLTYRERSMVRAVLIDALRARHGVPTTFEDLVWQMVEEGTWLPTISDEMYREQLAQLMFGRHRLETVHVFGTVDGSPSLYAIT